MSQTTNTNKLKVGINGFGRIGRLFYRAVKQRFPEEIEICAINDPQLTSEYVAYLMKHDTVYRDPGFEVGTQSQESVSVDGCSVQFFALKDAAEIPWKQCGVDIVADCSGLYTTTEKAKAHIDKEHGAKKVVLSAPPKDDITPTFVLGVNENDYNPEMTIVSNASCTTNCLAPLMKVMNDNFGVEEALMSTIHALTAAQNVVDAPCAKDFRGGRSALNNIIPAHTGAAEATTKVLPELSGRLTGMAFRVPVQDVSILDVTCRLRIPAHSIDAIAAAVHNTSGRLSRVIGVTSDAVVSSDMVGDDRSCILDLGASIVLNPHFVKLVAYYDNEWAYALRMAEFMQFMHHTDSVNTKTKA